MVFKGKRGKNVEKLPKTLVLANLIELCLCLQASHCPLGETSSPWIRLDSASASTLDWNQKHHQVYSKRTESYSRGCTESPTARLGKVESTLVVLILFCFYLISDWPSHMTFEISVPWPGIEPSPQKWKSRILTTRSLGNFSSWTSCAFSPKILGRLPTNDGEEQLYLVPGTPPRADPCYPCSPLSTHPFNECQRHHAVSSGSVHS